MKLIRILLLIFITISTSCMSQKNEKKDIMRECVNMKINNERSEKIDFYTALKQMETLLVSGKALKSVQKEDYIYFFKNITKDEKMFDEVKKIMIKYKLQPTFSLLDDLNNCYRYVLVTEKNDFESSLNFQNIALNNILLDGMDNDAISELINSTSKTDFQDIEYRASIIILSIYKLSVVST